MPNNIRTTSAERAFLEMLSIAFGNGLHKEQGLFRALVSMWFSHYHGGWLLKVGKEEGQSPLDSELGTSRWLNAFHIPRTNKGKFIETLNKGIRDGRFFVSQRLRRRIRADKRKSERRNRNRVYVEHAIPLAVLRAMIERRLKTCRSNRERRNAIEAVLKAHFALGWMLESEKSLAKPVSNMPPGIIVCCEAREGGTRHNRVGRNVSKKSTFRDDLHFCRYWTEGRRGKNGEIVPRRDGGVSGIGDNRVIRI